MHVQSVRIATKPPQRSKGLRKSWSKTAVALSWQLSRTGYDGVNDAGDKALRPLPDLSWKAWKLQLPLPWSMLGWEQYGVVPSLSACSPALSGKPYSKLDDEG